MNLFKKFYCRTYQTIFRTILPLLPYREPILLKSNQEIVNILQQHEKNSVLLVTDRSIRNLQLTQSLENAILNQKLKLTIYDETVPNPTTDNVATAVQLYQDNECDCIIAFGGGSVMDCAKATGARIARPKKSLTKMKGILKVGKKIPLLIAIPTTAGTGSETTLAAVITDSKTRHKYAINDFPLIPSYAALLPQLTIGLPQHITATTGMDALTHAIEGLITKGAWELSDMFEIKAIEMIAEYLPIAVEEPTNAKAREAMALGQYVAGMAFSNVGLGAVHGMAHPMGAIFDIPHGVANAVLLPTVMEYNKSAAKEKYVEIAKAMKVYKDTMSIDEAADAAVEAVKALSIKVGIPQTLTELGITEKDIDILAASAIADVCTPGNPRDIDEATIKELYKKIL